MLTTFCGWSSRGIGAGGSNINVSVAEFVRVTTTGVGTGVPGGSVSGVVTVSGCAVSYGVGVWVDVVTGCGAVADGADVCHEPGGCAGVSAGAVVAGSSGVRLGVRPCVSVWEGVGENDAGAAGLSIIPDGFVETALSE
ncbi:MAG: hypothetical protein PVJ55_01305 [Anaerolineae bacterium]|jgi:hypothetical protein